MIELELTPGQAVKVSNALSELGKKDLSFKAAYAIDRNLSKVSGIAEKYMTTLRERYIEKHGELTSETFDLVKWGQVDADLFKELSDAEKFSFMYIDLNNETTTFKAYELSQISELLKPTIAE
jgi:hypothetical protein